MGKCALVIGINRYPDAAADLQGCVNDADDWSAALSARGYAVTQLLDAYATKEGILTHLAEAIADGRRDDSIVVTFSGHGSAISTSVDATPPEDVLCPYDIATGNALTYTDISPMLARLGSGVRLFLFVDACHSGGFEKPADANAIARFLPPERFPSQGGTLREHQPPSESMGLRHPKTLYLAACGAGEVAHCVQGSRPNGALTKAALAALSQVSAQSTYRQWFKVIQTMLPSPAYDQHPRLVGTKAQTNWPTLS